MMHLKLEQSISNREIVSDKIIKKLYELVSSGTLDNTSHLQGWLYVPVTYRLYQETITLDSNTKYVIVGVVYADSGNSNLLIKDSTTETILFDYQPS